MTTKNQVHISRDVAQKKIFVEREFDAPVDKVWRFWTEAELLDTWWAPRPWKTETKSMDFREGGRWLYSMVGPAGERHWCLADYLTIEKQKSYTGLDSFCDENGNLSTDMPRMHWKVDFFKIATGTKIKVEITFTKEEDMNKIIEMGFEQGFTMGLGNLDEELAK